MDIKKIIYSSDRRIRFVWRILIFASLLLLSLAPLLLINNSTLQFFGAAVVLMIGLYFNARYLDKRDFSAYGLKLHRQTFVYLVVGILIGLLTVALLLGIGKLTETLSITKSSPSPELASALLFGCKMLLVAIIEETLYRGYLFSNLYESLPSKSLSKSSALILAVGLSSALFGLAHFGNDSASIRSMSLLTINGVVWCIPFILTNNLGLSIGLHAAWNFAQSLVGFTMSGNQAAHSFFTIENVGSVIWTGGEYGPDAGLLGLIGFLIMLFLSLVFIRFYDSSIKHSSER
ncbi:MAG: lysostaphin resistance A-like protein [Cyclobacteriaceae bacterium]